MSFQTVHEGINI